MKQMMISALLLFVAMTAGAQGSKQEAINEKFFDAKVSELVYRLDMTDEQKTKFTPIYRRYCEEMRATWGTMQRPQKGQKPQTDEEKLARTKQKMERQQKAQSVRLKYVDEFAKVLTAQQVNRFFEVESKIQKKLMDRRKHPKGKDGHKLRKKPQDKK